MKMFMTAGRHERHPAVAGAGWVVCGVLLLGLAIAANAADSRSNSREPEKSKDIVLANDAAKPTASDPEPGRIPSAPPALLPEISAFSGAMGDVGLHLLRTDAARGQGSGNRVVSPFGVASVLGMLHAGASGATADEIAAVLEPSVSKGRKLGERMRFLTRELHAPKPGIEIASAHRLWVDASLAKSISPAYAQLVSENYRADGVLTHFSDAPASLAAINQWAEQATHGKIGELVAPGALQATTRILATSAVYMKSAWAEPFNPAATRMLPFFSQQGQGTPVPTMTGTMRVRLGSHKGLQILEIPYMNGDFVFYAALPRNPAHTLDAMQQDVTGLDIVAWPQIVSPVTADVYLPRFCIDARPLSLKDALLTVGMHTAFSDRAGFEGIAGKADISLDNILHGAGITVDEKGSEAAAATAAVARVKSYPTLEHQQIHIDRPFLFVIMHKPSATPLFAGRVSMPTL